MKRQLSLGAAVAALFIFPLPAHAGGWTQSPGAGYSKVWATYLDGQGAYGVDGGAVNTEEFVIAKTTVYGEYGLADDLTIVGVAEPFGIATHGDASQTFAGAFLAGLRRRFVSRPFQFAVEARAGGQPGLGERDLANGADEFVFIPTIGTGQFEWEFQLGIGLPFGWIALSAGPRLLTARSLSDELMAFGQIGLQPLKGLMVDVHASFNHTLAPLARVNTTGVGNTRYLGIGLGISYWLTDFLGVHLGADGAIYAESNARSPAYLAGVEFRTR